VDFSIPVNVTRLSQVTYDPTSTSGFVPVTTNSTNSYVALDLFLPKSDIKSVNWTRYPHPIAGIAFAKQPLHNILTAIAWGPHFAEFYAGVSFVKQPRVAAGSDSCGTSGAAGTPTPASFGYHFCHPFAMGINLPVTGLASKLGSPQ
jgi:hypothetical protein